MTYSIVYIIWNLVYMSPVGSDEIVDTVYWWGFAEVALDRFSL